MASNFVAGQMHDRETEIEESHCFLFKRGSQLIVGEIIQEKWCHQAIWCRSFIGPTSVCLRPVQTFASAGLSSAVYKSN